MTAARHSFSTPHRVIGANWMGKTKFCLQTAVVGLGYAYLILDTTGRRLPGGKPLLFWLLVLATATSWAFLLNFCRWLAHGQSSEEENN